MKTFPVVSEFNALFDRAPRHRRPILVIVGGSSLGRSLLATQIMKEIGNNMGIPGYDEVTVEGSNVIDLSNFDHRHHCGVILDGAGASHLLFDRNKYFFTAKTWKSSFYDD